jgi:hypothetical protein
MRATIGNSEFRHSAARACHLATDLIILIGGAGYALQSVAHGRSTGEIATGVAISGVGGAMTALTVRAWRRRRYHQAPNNE